MSEPLLQDRAAAAQATPGFADPNAGAACRARERLHRELLDHQRRLGRLLERRDPADATRIDACRREIRIRRALLRDLPRG